MAAISDTDQGQYDGDTQWDRAVGPMQFIPGTWKSFGADGNGDGVKNPHNIFDAARAAGDYLCSGGANLADAQGLVQSVLRYNHSMDYVSTVLRWMQSYSKQTVKIPDQDGQITPPGDDGNVDNPSRNDDPIPTPTPTPTVTPTTTPPTTPSVTPTPTPKPTTPKPSTPKPSTPTSPKPPYSPTPTPTPADDAHPDDAHADDAYPDDAYPDDADPDDADADPAGLHADADPHPDAEPGRDDDADRWRADPGTGSGRRPGHPAAVHPGAGGFGARNRPPCRTVDRPRILVPARFRAARVPVFVSPSGTGNLAST